VWFRQRLGDAGGRKRKVPVVALARKLLVALWKYATQAVVPEGATARTA
jgi:transposase